MAAVAELAAVGWVLPVRAVIHRQISISVELAARRRLRRGRDRRPPPRRRRAAVSKFHRIPLAARHQPGLGRHRAITGR